MIPADADWIPLLPSRLPFVPTAKYLLINRQTSLDFHRAPFRPRTRRKHTKAAEDSTERVSNIDYVKRFQHIAISVARERLLPAVARRKYLFSRLLRILRQLLVS